MVSILIDAGATLRLPAAAALGRDADVARLLRRDPDALKPEGRWSRLILRASEHGSGEMVETLLRNGASVNIRARFWGDEAMRTDVSTPAMLGNNS